MSIEKGRSQEIELGCSIIGITCIHTFLLSLLIEALDAFCFDLFYYSLNVFICTPV